MKKIVTSALFIMASVVMTTSTASAAWCEPKYMHDPCPTDSFDMIQVEKFVKGKHNWMRDIHNNGKKKRVTKKKKRKVYRKRVKVKNKKRYKYIKKCRVVKVRI